MNSARPARSVLSRCLRQPASSVSTAPCRSFQTSACRPKGKPRFKNLKAAEMGLTSPEAIEKFATQHFPEYTEEEKAILRKKYTPEQYEALEAGEEAIDPRDLTTHGQLRDDPYKIPYVEDFATIQPIIDAKPQQTPAPKEVKFLPHKEWVDDYIQKLANTAEKSMKDSIGKAVARALRKVKGTNPDMIDYTEEELVELENNPELRRKYIIEGDADPEVANLIAEKDANPTGSVPREEWWDKIDEEFYKELSEDLNSEKSNPLMPKKIEVWKDMDGVEAGSSALAPELGKVPGVEGLYKPPVDPEDEGLDDSGEFQEIKRLTGMKMRDILSVPSKRLVSRNVSNQTRLGKIRSSSVMVVAGNGDGRLGIGVAKSTDPEVANLTAKLLAIRNMRPIRRYENRTIYGDVEAKVSGTIVQLRARPPGFGLRVSHRIFEMCRLAGIHDLAAKIPRSKNPMNTVKATYDALMNQPDPEQIAMGRGKKLVDARKVYYGGAVY